MPSLTEGELVFDFPAGWQAAKLDDWSFYRNQFQQVGSNLRATCPQCNVELRCRQCGSARIPKSSKWRTLAKSAGPYEAGNLD